MNYELFNLFANTLHLYNKQKHASPERIRTRAPSYFSQHMGFSPRENGHSSRSSPKAYSFTVNTPS